MLTPSWPAHPVVEGLKSPSGEVNFGIQVKFSCGVIAARAVGAVVSGTDIAGAGAVAGAGDAPASAAAGVIVGAGAVDGEVRRD